MVEIRLADTDHLLWFDDRPQPRQFPPAPPGGERPPLGPCDEESSGPGGGWRAWTGSLRRKLLLASLVCVAAHLLMNAFLHKQALIPNTPLLCQALFLIAAVLIGEAFYLLQRPVNCCARHRSCGGGFLAWGMFLATSPVVWILARLANLL